MEFIRLLFSSKITTLLALVAVLAGVLADPQWLGVVPQDWAAMLTTLGAIAAALSRGLVDADGDGVPDILQGRRGNADLRFVAVMLVAGVGLLALLACTTQLSATMRFGPTDVEYGCAASPPNNRCIVVIRDSIAPGNMPVLVTDTVPVGVTRTVAITRQLTAGQRVVVLGSFEGLTATGKKAGPVNLRAETVYDPAAVSAVPFLRFAPPS